MDAYTETNVVNDLSYNKQNASSESDSKAMTYSHCFGTTVRPTS